MNHTSISSSPLIASFTLDSRTHFLVRTYAHLLLATITFVAVEMILFQTGIAALISRLLFGVHWAPVAAAVMLVAWLGREAARQADAPVVQYLAFFSCVITEAIILIPLLFMAEFRAVGLIQSADIVTLLGSVSLTCLVLSMRNHFSLAWLVPLWGLIASLLFLLVWLLLGRAPSLLISVGTIALAGLLILYETAILLHNSSEKHPIPVALELFTALMLPLGTIFSFYRYQRRS